MQTDEAILGKSFLRGLIFVHLLKKNFFRVYTIYFHTCLVLMI